jgi:putative oxidoreductase
MYVPGFDIKRTAPYGLAILRIVVGVALLVHGWSKWANGIDGVAGFFASLGIPAATFFAYVVAIVETVGGLFLIVGFLTQIVGILVFIDMVGAVLFAYLGQGSPFIDRGAVTWETEALFGVAALCLALTGPGAWSVDGVMGDTRTRAARAV